MVFKASAIRHQLLWYLSTNDFRSASSFEVHSCSDIRGSGMRLGSSGGGGFTEDGLGGMGRSNRTVIMFSNVIREGGA